MSNLLFCKLFFSKKIYETGGHSLVWLEYWPVTPKVAGSSPVVLETAKISHKKRMFLGSFFSLCLEKEKKEPLSQCFCFIEKRKQKNSF